MAEVPDGDYRPGVGVLTIVHDSGASSMVAISDETHVTVDRTGRSGAPEGWSERWHGHTTRTWSVVQASGTAGTWATNTQLLASGPQPPDIVYIDDPHRRITVRWTSRA